MKKNTKDYIDNITSQFESILESIKEDFDKGECDYSNSLCAVSYAIGLQKGSLITIVNLGLITEEEFDNLSEESTNKAKEIENYILDRYNIHSA